MSDPISRLNAALEGRYRVERKLGEGGMATVYLADDLRHERKVALKVLKPELAAVVGAERFLAEIKTTANLQHPHILPLFDSGEADRFLFYVMPYVEGESLRERLDREHQLPVNEAVRIAINVSEALDYAHSHGVIHRDIKPANILLQAGKPVISDFGIALAVSAGGGGRLTETGLSLGTPHYMSPEQATGDLSVGAASDIYAVGCVLYESLVGHPPFIGGTAQAILGKIVTGDADPVTKHRRTVPPNVDAAIRRALEKVPADRFAGAGDLAAALSNPAFRHAEAVGVAGTVSDVRRWQLLAAAASVVAVAAVGAGLAGLFGPEQRAPRVSRQEIRLSSLDYRVDEVIVAIASDGGILYRDREEEGLRSQLFYKARNDERGEPVPDTDGVFMAVFSPDGQRMAYVRGGSLVVRPVARGAPIMIAEDGDLSTPAVDWLDDGTILYETEDGPVLKRISADGAGPVQTVTTQNSLMWARQVRGYDQALVTALPLGVVPGQPLGILDLVSGEITWHLRDVARAWYVPPGRIVYGRSDGAVFATSYDPSTGALGGAGISLFEGVLVDGDRIEMLVGDDGTLLWLKGAAEQPKTSFVWRDRQGGTERIDMEPVSGRVVTLALSPDGRSAAYDLQGRGSSDIWVQPLPSGAPSRLTDGEGRYRSPTWTPDGRSVVFVDQSIIDGMRILRMRADGSTREIDTLGVSARVFFAQVTPDAGALVFDGYQESGSGILYRDLVDDAQVTALTTEAGARAARVSPDGRWFAYSSADAVGPTRIFVRPLPDATASRSPISLGQAGNPFWSRDATELFYVRSPGRTVMAVSFEASGSDFEVIDRVPLFDYPESSSVGAVDVAPTGQRFLVAVEESAPASEEARLILVQNWLEELRELTAGS